MGFLRRLMEDWSPLERRAILQHGGRPRVTGLAHGDVLDIEDREAIDELNDLPRHGQRWRRTEDAWERWSYLDSSWQRDLEREPDDLPADVAVGTVVVESETGDWVVTDHDPETVDLDEPSVPVIEWPTQ